MRDVTNEILYRIRRDENVLEIVDAEHLVLGHGHRNERKIVLIHAAGPDTHRLEDADDLESVVSKPNTFADRIDVFAKEGRCKIGTDDRNVVIGGDILSVKGNPFTIV